MNVLKDHRIYWLKIVKEAADRLPESLPKGKLNVEKNQHFRRLFSKTYPSE